jgi:aminopeptidase N
VEQRKRSRHVFRTERGDTFTNDEPVGAFSWYAVNDQPSDKAFYDFQLAVPAPRVGVANGRMLSRERRRRQVVTQFHLDRPAASYLITVELGRYRRTSAGEVGRTPVTLWTPRGGREGDRRALRAARYLPKALTWLEQRLGRYPFATVSVIVVDGYHSGMENQTLVTVGNTPYYRSREVLLHELAHQWYGDLVTPRDWRDVWMNEGMATYLQQVYASRHDRESLEERMRSFVSLARSYWTISGPPARYHRRPFGDGNVYYPPMLMWHELREKVGYAPFWSVVRAWPHVHPYGSSGRVSYTHWIQTRFERDLRGFFMHGCWAGPCRRTSMSRASRLVQP